MRLCIGVTGHRDLLAHEKPALKDKVRNFLQQMDAAYPGLDLQLISPLAEGSDQLVAEVALELGIHLVVPMPMKQSDYEKDFVTAQGVTAFRNMLARAEVIELPENDEVASADATIAEAARNQQYMQMGVFMSNHCQLLLALWDGKRSEEQGGTYGVVKYHLTAVMPGFSIAEESPNLLADNENDLAYHLVVSRDRPDGAPTDELKPLQATWLSAHFERSPDGQVPAEFHEMLLRLQEYNADFTKYQATIRQQGRGLLEDAPDIEHPGGSAFVDRLFRNTDWLAIHFQKRFNQGMLVTHGLAVAMGVVFIVYTEYEVSEWLLHVFLAMFFTGVVFHLIGNRRQWHRKYLDYRALAEGLRVQMYWNLAGVVETGSAVFAYDNFLQKQDVDLGWIRHVMRSASLKRDRRRAPDDRWVEWVSEQWVGRREDDAGQLAYYHQKSQFKAARYLRTTRLGSLSLWTGIVIAVFLAVMAGGLSEPRRNFLLVLMGVLPLIAGVRDTYSHKKAERELIKQYRFMGRVFSNARRLLDSDEDLAFKRRVLKAVGNAALEEHAEWILMHRERPLEHGGL